MIHGDRVLELLECTTPSVTQDREAAKIKNTKTRKYTNDT